MTDPDFRPVPLRNRSDGWTPDRQWHFIQRLGDTASVRLAAEAVGMSESSAHRLRRHPEAADFRAAWDAALGQAWGQLEQAALERALHGETETICRDGEPAYTRHRPCSDRLLVHLLKERSRFNERQEAAREAARRAAALAAAEAGRATFHTLPRTVAPAHVPDAAEAETAALHDLHGITQGFPDRTGWDGPQRPAPGADAATRPPLLPTPAKMLAPDDGVIGVGGAGARVRRPARPRPPRPPRVMLDRFGLPVEQDVPAPFDPDAWQRAPQSVPRVRVWD